MQPQYNINDFITDCITGVSKVYASKNTLETARADFNLNTQGQVFEFIGNGGLESPSFISCRPWKNNPDPSNQIFVDAYGFYSGFIYGYIAFFYQLKMNKWIIKSFKKNIDLDPRNLAIKDALTSSNYTVIQD